MFDPFHLQYTLFRKSRGTFQSSAYGRRPLETQVRLIFACRAFPSILRHRSLDPFSSSQSSVRDVLTRTTPVRALPSRVLPRRRRLLPVLGFVYSIPQSVLSTILHTPRSVLKRQSILKLGSATTLLTTGYIQSLSCKVFQFSVKMPQVLGKRQSPDATEADLDVPTTPTESPTRKRRKITQNQKQALIDNLQLESASSAHPAYK